MWFQKLTHSYFNNLKILFTLNINEMNLKYLLFIIQVTVGIYWKIQAE